MLKLASKFNCKDNAEPMNSFFFLLFTAYWVSVPKIKLIIYVYLGGGESSESSDFTMILLLMSWIVNLESESSSCSSFVKFVLIGAWSASVYCMNLQAKHDASQFNWPHSCLLSEDFLSILIHVPCSCSSSCTHRLDNRSVALFLCCLKCWWA